MHGPKAFTNPKTSMLSLRIVSEAPIRVPMRTISPSQEPQGIGGKVTGEATERSRSSRALPWASDSAASGLNSAVSHSAIRETFSSRGIGCSQTKKVRADSNSRVTRPSLKGDRGGALDAGA